MNNLSPSIQEVSESRRCAVHIGFNTADIVYLICDHLTLGEAAVLAFVSSSLMDILRGKLAKLNVDGNLEHSQYAMQRLRFFDYKMPGNTGVCLVTSIILGTRRLGGPSARSCIMGWRSIQIQRETSESIHRPLSQLRTYSCSSVPSTMVDLSTGSGRGTVLTIDT